MCPFQVMASLPAPHVSSTSHAYHMPPKIEWDIALPCETVALESGPIAPASTLPRHVPLIPKMGAIALISSPGFGMAGASCAHATAAAIPPQQAMSITNAIRWFLFMAPSLNWRAVPSGHPPPLRAAGLDAGRREIAPARPDTQPDPARDGARHGHGTTLPRPRGARQRSLH